MKPVAIVGYPRLAISPLSMCLCAGIARTTSAMDIYKWVDETGVTHYSNKKPAGVKSKLMPPPD